MAESQYIFKTEQNLPKDCVEGRKTAEGTKPPPWQECSGDGSGPWSNIGGGQAFLSAASRASTPKRHC